MEYNKAIRDKIPEIIQKDGYSCNVKTLSDEEFLEHLENSYIKGEFLKLDASTLISDEKFEGIYSNKVLHHLTDEALLLSVKRQSELLKEGGIICHYYY